MKAITSDPAAHKAGLAALQYHPDAFDTGGARLMGRQAAGEALLKAWVRHSGANPMTCWTADPRHAELFARNVRDLGWTGAVQAARPDRPGPLREAGALWLAGPELGRPAWLRRRFGDASWSLVGITHTTASHAVMDAIADYPIAPVQPWDALICTSRAVRGMVEEVLEAQRAHLTARLGAQSFPLPRLPVIPLGVHPEDFAPDAGARAEWRAKLGIGVDEIAILQMGRLSFHAKAHPLPMYLALEEAARRTGVRPHLILAGWFANEGQERVFRQGAAECAPSVQLHIVDARPPEVRRNIWSAADMFTLLVDNVQETFGLAPVEAMAAGLPVVVSDWDGFKDTVGHGVHGYRVPTLQPPPGAGDPLAARYEAGVDSYDIYVGASAQSIAVDVAAAADAYAALFRYAGRRQAMGAAGRAHVEAQLSWRVVIGQYRALLADLAERRAAAPSGQRAGAQPAREDPFRLFRGYPTALLGAETRLRRRAGAGEIERLHALAGTKAVGAAIPPPADLARLLERCGEGVSVGALLAEVDRTRAADALRGIGWLVKMDLLQVAGE